MITNSKFSRVAPAIVFLALVSAHTAQAGSHLWRVSEIFSSADGRVQFVELKEIGGSDEEFHLTGRWFLTNNHFLQLTTDLPGPTANLNFLLGTQAFADLPGAPSPDYLIPESFIDVINGDELVWFTYDVVTLDPGQVPTDGMSSLYRFTMQTDLNSPTNFAGDTGSVIYLDTDTDGIADALDNCTLVANSDQRDTDSDGFGNLCDPDLNNDNIVNFSDLGAFKAVFFTADRDADLDGDGTVSFSDLAIVKAFFFGAPGPSGL